MDSQRQQDLGLTVVCLQVYAIHSLQTGFEMALLVEWALILEATLLLDLSMAMERTQNCLVVVVLGTCDIEKSHFYIMKIVVGLEDETPCAVGA